MMRIKPFHTITDPLQSADPDLWKGLTFAYHGNELVDSVTGREPSSVSNLKHKWSQAGRGVGHEIGAVWWARFYNIVPKNQGMTWEVLFQIDSWTPAGGGSEAVIFSQGSWPDIPIQIVVTEFQELFCSRGTGTAFTKVDGMTLGLHHVVVTFSAFGTCYMYLNGEQVGSFPYNEIPYDSNPISIGRRLDFEQALNGAVIAARIWNGRILTPLEVKKLYRDPFALTRPVGSILQPGPPDETPPELGDPTITAILISRIASAEATFTSNESITFHTVLTQSDTPPTAQQVWDGEDENGDPVDFTSTGSGSPGSHYTFWTDLLNDTVFHGYVVGRDLAGNLSEVLYLGSFMSHPPDDGVYITGVVAIDKVPVEGARVFLIDTQSMLLLETTTGEYGIYLFDGLADDGREYHVTAQYRDGETLYHGRSQPFLLPT